MDFQDLSQVKLDLAQVIPTQNITLYIFPFLLLMRDISLKIRPVRAQQKDLSEEDLLFHNRKRIILHEQESPA